MRESVPDMRERIEMQHHNVKKGQIWSLDFITSVIVFLIVLIPLLFVWSYINVQNEQEIRMNDIESLALSVSDALIRTKGFPEGWDASNVETMGLASEENVLNDTKVSYFVTMGNNEYNRTRAILTGSYDFFFNLTDLNGSSYGTIGSKPADRITVPIERYCLYNERIVKMELTLID
jgi:hypothetical protein